MILYLGMVHSIRFEAGGISSEVELQMRGPLLLKRTSSKEHELSGSVSTIGGISFEEVKPFG